MINTEYIEKLLLNSSKIRKAAKFYYDPIKGDCDKIGLGFNLDERFQACLPVKISLDSWQGYYGDSSCKTTITLDKVLFDKYLVGALNASREEIFKMMAYLMENDAKELKDLAVLELEDKLKTINSL